MTTASGPAWAFMSDKNYRKWIDRQHANEAYERESSKKYGLNTNNNNANQQTPTTDGNASNPNFSWNNEQLWQQARDLSRLQLDNTIATMGAAAGHREREINLNDEVARRQEEQRFGFQKQLADDNYAFRDRERGERFAQEDEDRERRYIQRRELLDDARDSASRAFYGGNRFDVRR